MNKIITCPCCGKEILINDDGSTVFFIAQNSKEMKALLEEKEIELGVVKGGD